MRCDYQNMVRISTPIKRPTRHRNWCVLCTNTRISPQVLGEVPIMGAEVSCMGRGSLVGVTFKIWCGTKHINGNYVA